MSGQDSPEGRILGSVDPGGATTQDLPTATTPNEPSRAYTRAGTADKIRRRALIAKLLARGVAAGDITRTVAAMFSISERAARAAVAEVRAAWREEISANEVHRRTELLGRLDAIIAGAFADRAWGAAVAGCRELARVLGLDAQRVVVDGFTDDEIATLRALRIDPPPTDAVEARARLDALKLTPAQRTARIAALEQAINEGTEHEDKG